MNLTRQIFENLNESEMKEFRRSRRLKEVSEVKKPYGETPEEGKTEAKKSTSTGVKIGTKVQNTAKVKPLENKNKEAGEVYANDTDKYNDNIDDSKHTDKGDVAKKNTKKAYSGVKLPYGDKVDTPSDNKLIKENEDLEECGDKEIKEGEGCADCKEKLNEDNSFLSFQNQIEQVFEDAKASLDENLFLDFCDGVINLAQNYSGTLSQLECDKNVKKSDLKSRKNKKLNETSETEYAQADLYDEVRRKCDFDESYVDDHLTTDEVSGAVEKALEELRDYIYEDIVEDETEYTKEEFEKRLENIEKNLDAYVKKYEKYDDERLDSRDDFGDWD